MADIDSSEIFGAGNSGDDGFSQSNFKNLAAAAPAASGSHQATSSASSPLISSLNQAAAGGERGAETAPIPFPAPTSADQATSSEQAAPELVVPPLLTNHQFREILAFPPQFFEYAVRSIFPGILPSAQDQEAEKQRKQATWAKIQGFDQEMKQIFLQKSQAWQEKQALAAQESQAKKEQIAQQQEAAQATLPVGKQSGAQAITGSTKAKTTALHQQLKTSNSDRTQGAA